MKKWINVAMFLGYYLLFILFPGLAQIKVKGEISSLNFNHSATLITIIINSLPMLVVGYFLGFNKKNSQKNVHPIAGILFFPILICISLFMMNILLTFLSRLGLFVPNIKQNIQGPIPSLYGLAALACLAIGYSEESFFRAAAKSTFVANSAWKSYMITSIFFGIAHLGQGIAGIIFSTLAAIVLAFFYEKLTRHYGKVGWHLTAIGHGMYNFVMLLLAK
ncbi:MAG: CPBP family intramembrane glutamic endopeptidase [Spirochaetia bacterium]